MNKKENTLNQIIIIFVILFVVFFFMFIVAAVANNSLQKENNIYVKILKADYDFSKVSIDSQKAEQYYLEASYAYENQEYRLVESNCRLARGYYSEEAQGYENIKAEMKATEIEDELINIYTNILEEIIDATYNMFEACEHFESAARYYETYYNTNVPYDDASYNMGTSEIESMNEKIIAHDEAIKEYNSLLEEFRVELKKRIE